MRFVKKIRIYFNKNEQNKVDFWLRRCKTLYNTALEHKIEYYKKTGKFINAYEQKKELPVIKKYDSTWSNVPNKSLSDVIFRLDKTFKGFFSKTKGFPKFKNNDNFKTIYFDKTDVRLKNDLVFLPKIKKGFKLNEEVKPNYTSVLLTKERQGEYYLIFNYEDGKTINYNSIDDKKLKAVGVDLGLIDILTDSTGKSIDRFSLKLVKKYVNRIDSLNKSLSNKKKGSRGRRKVKKHLNKAYCRLKRSRKDYYNKEISKYVKNLKEQEVKVLVVGDIKVSEIVKNKDKISKNKDINDKVNVSSVSVSNKSKRYLRRSFGRSGVGEFKVMLKNKCEGRGVKVYLVDERDTSKTCSSCMRVKANLNLSDRMYKCECEKCKNHIRRDVNSAFNMLNVWHGQFNPIKV